MNTKELQVGEMYDAETLNKLVGNRELYIQDAQYPHRYHKFSGEQREKILWVCNSFKVDHICVNDLPVVHVSLPLKTKN